MLRCLLGLSLLVWLIACTTSSPSSPPAQESDEESSASPSPTPTIGKGGDLDSQESIIPHQISEAELPPGLEYGPTFHHALGWEDQLGSNYLIFSSEEVTISPYMFNHSIFADHYAGKEGEWKRISRTQDFNQECEFDNMLQWVPEATRITDLDQNQIAEFSFMYTLGCISDVSPYPLKLIMREGPDKMAIRGSIRLKITDEDGKATLMFPKDKNVDGASFAGKPAPFQSFAEALWDEYEVW